MPNTTEQFLEFHGKKITLVASDSKFYIPVKPICEALGVDYRAQHKSVSNDEILGQLSSIQTTTGADGKRYEMFCLPEKYIYGWLFSINSDSPGLKRYKQECYEVLWNHFHSITSQRRTELEKRRSLRDEYHEIHRKKMAGDAEYKRLLEIQNELKNTATSLKSYDQQLEGGQTSLNFDV